MDDHELRRYVRTNFSCRIKITHPSLGDILVKTRDISDGGVFVVLEPEQIPAVGTRLTGQVQGLMEDAPILELEVVRVESGGVGLRFVQED
jgi:hypothetical protein